MTDRSPLLSVRNVVKTFPAPRSLTEIAYRRPARRLVALDDVSLTLTSNQVIGIVGESGSGKTTLANCIMGLHTPDAGSVQLNGQELIGMRSPVRRKVSRRIQMVFQDPYSSLNPRRSIGQTLTEPLRVHKMVKPGQELTRAAELLERVGLRPEYQSRFPRELSGGQRQRVAIARALTLQPDVLVADEAVSALDVSVQAQILNLLQQLQTDLGLAILFITHQLAVISHLADQVIVLYLGRVMETGPVAKVFVQTRHPYTQGLLAAQPTTTSSRVDRAPAIAGELPSPLAIPTGCRFHTRCPLALPLCAQVEPPLVEVSPGHMSACHVLAPSSHSEADSPVDQQGGRQ